MEEGLSLTQVGIIILLTNFAKDFLAGFMTNLSDNGRMVVTSALVIAVSTGVYFGQILLAMLPPELATIIALGLIAAGGWSTAKRTNIVGGSK